MSQRNEPAETMAALDEMEDNLRHHGLGHEAAGDPVKRQAAAEKRSKGPADGSAAYMASIRAAKEERRRLRVEREYRQYMATQQEVRDAKDIPEAGDARAAQAAIVDGAATVLQAETRAAAEAISAHAACSAADAVRAHQVAQRQQQERQILAARMGAATAAACAEAGGGDSGGPREPRAEALVAVMNGSPTAKGVGPQREGASGDVASLPRSALSSAGQGRLLWEGETMSNFCGGIVAGVVSLAIRVADNRFLPETTTSITGEPVRRIEQDLPVTTWRQWVDECVWSRAMAASVADRAGKSRAGGSLHDGSLLGAGGAGGPLDMSLCDDEEVEVVLDFAKDAHEHIAFAAQQQRLHEDALGCEAVERCVEHLRAEGERLCKAAVEGIRRDSEECEGGASALAVGKQVEEVYPGWAQRMPPAGCFVFGDDLSGSRLLTETVEKAFLAATAGGVSQAHRRGSQFSGEGLNAGRSGAESHRGSTQHAQQQQSPVAGVTRVEGGLQRAYVTPRTLLNHFPAGGCGASRGQSANRTRGAAGGKGGAALGSGGGGSSTAANSAPGASGAAPNANNSSGSGARRTSSGEDEERREHEALAEALSRELVVAHVHNLHVGTQGRLPESLSSVQASNAAMAAAGVGGTTLPAEKTPQKRGGNAGPSGSAVAGAQQRPHGPSGKRDVSPSRGDGGSTTSASPFTVPQDGEEGGDGGSGPFSPTLMLPRTVTMVGFPQSETFYQLLQQKLHVAVAAAENALLLHQAYQRLVDEAASGEQSGPLNGAAFTTPHGQGTKGSTQPPVGGKGKAGAKAATTVAALPLQTADHVQELRATTSFPPLCVVGCFLEYSLLERRKRLEGAYTRPVQSASAAAATTATASSPSSLCHDLYSPEVITGVYRGKGNSVSSGGGVGSTAASSTTNAAPPAAPSPIVSTGLLVAHAYAKKAAAALSDSSSAALAAGAAAHPGHVEQLARLPVAQMREVMSEQQSQSTQWPMRWQEAFLDAITLNRVTASGDGPQTNGGTDGSGATTAAASANAPAAATGGAPSASPLSTNRDAKARRRRNTVSMDVPDGPATQPPQPHAGSPPDAPSAAAEQQEVASAVAFPKVLFFTRRCTLSTEEELAEGDSSGLEAGETPLYAFRGSNFSLDIDRARVLAALCATVAAATTTSVMQPQRLYSAETLAPRQLLAPLRLSDYRRSSQVCARLIVTHRAYSTAFSAPGRSRWQATSVPSSPLASSGDRVPSLAAQLEVYRAFNLFVHELFSVVARDVFPDSLWPHGSSPAASPSALHGTNNSHNHGSMELTNTMHFNSIDASYEEAKIRVATLRADLLTQMRQRCLVWWLHSLKAALSATAEALRRLVDEMHAVYHVSAKCEKDVGDQFLSQVRPLQSAEMDHFASLFATDAEAVSGDSFALRLCALHDGYFADVKAAAVAVVRAASAKLFPSQPAPAAGEPIMVAPLPLAHKSEASAPAAAAAAALAAPVPVTQPDWGRLAPVLVERILARLFALPADDPSDGASSGVSPFLAQCTLVMQELVRAASETGLRAETWLNHMYHVALQVPPTAQFPETGVRPRTVGEFYGPLPTAHRSPTSAAPPARLRADGEEVSPWQRMNLVTYLGNLSLYGRPTLAEDEFLHVHILTSLQSLWQHLDDGSAELATAVGVACPPLLPRPAPTGQAGDRETPGSMWMQSFLQLCTCRPAAVAARGGGGGVPAATATPFLSLEEIRQLYRRHASDAGGPLDLRRFSLSLVLRRCCFCGRDDAGAACAWQARWAVPTPTTREVRHAAATLPACVRGQRRAHRPDSETSTASPFAAGGQERQCVSGTVGGAVAAEWAAVQWWTTSPTATQADGPLWASDASLPWSLLQVLTSRFSLAKGGCLHAACPALPEVLRLLAGEGRAAGTTMERMYHAVAGVRAADSASGSSFKPVDVDTVALSVPEFDFYFSALAHPPGKVGSPPFSLAEDAQLLVWLQARRAAERGVVSGVTLPMLLASHWGRALVDAHFAP